MTSFAATVENVVVVADFEYVPALDSTTPVALVSSGATVRAGVLQNDDTYCY
jgi:hypothetical protein